MSNIAHFSINADDVARARHFYETVFGWKFKQAGPPDFYMIDAGETEEPSRMESLHPRRELKEGPRMNGYECTISVPSLSGDCSCDSRSERKHHHGRDHHRWDWSDDRIPRFGRQRGERDAIRQECKVIRWTLAAFCTIVAPDMELIVGSGLVVGILDADRMGIHLNSLPVAESRRLQNFLLPLILEESLEASLIKAA